jgi:hypothetical protein
MTDLRERRAALFRNLESPGTQARFFDQVADDVDGTVEGTRNERTRSAGA